MDDCIVVDLNEYRRKRFGESESIEIEVAAFQEAAIDALASIGEFCDRHGLCQTCYQLKEAACTCFDAQDGTP